MKYRILFALCACAVLLSSCALSVDDSEMQKIDVEDSPLHHTTTSITIYGDVKSVTITEYDVEDKFCEPVKKMRWKDIHTYDEHGKQLTWDARSQDGSMFSHRVYTYDEAGKELSCSVYNEDGLDYKTVNTYDILGTWEKTMLYGADGSKEGKWCSTYDEKGNLLTTVNYVGENVSGWSSYTYDDNGNPLSCLVYFPDNLICSKITYTYDEHGNLLEKAEYHSDGSTLREKDAYTYDEAGRKLSCISFGSDGSITNKVIYAYDNKGVWQSRLCIDGADRIYEIAEVEVIYRSRLCSWLRRLVSSFK